MDPRKKIDILKGSFESGVIDKEEYNKWKEKFEHGAKEFDKHVEEINKNVEEISKKSSDIILILSIITIVLLFIGIIAYSLYNKQQPKTLEELHVLNLQGKLKPSQGYVYKGIYSFIKFEDFWYTDLSSPKETKTYSMNFRYSPRDLGNITIEGSLNSDFFNNQTEFYYTFNPTGKELSYVFLAVADFSMHMSKVFGKNPIAACDRNETQSCKIIPIVTCRDTDKVVLYIKEAERFRTYYNNNCIVVEGSGLDLVKGVDRVLYNLYNIMAQGEEQ